MYVFLYLFRINRLELMCKVGTVYTKWKSVIHSSSLKPATKTKFIVIVSHIYKHHPAYCPLIVLFDVVNLMFSSCIREQ